MLPGLARTVEAAADLLVSILEGEERRLEPEDAIRWMLLALGPEETIPASVQGLVLQTVEAEREHGRGGSRALIDLCERLGDRHPELLSAFRHWYCTHGSPSGLIRGVPRWSVHIRSLRGGAAAWLNTGGPVPEVLGSRTVTLGPIGAEADLWWLNGALTLVLEEPAAWSPDPFTLVRRGVTSDVRATPLAHDDRLILGDAELRVDGRSLQERAREAAGQVGDLVALLPGLSVTLLLLAIEASRWPRRPVPSQLQQLLRRSMDPPVRALLLIRAHWAFPSIEVPGFALGALDTDVPIMEKDGRGPHADTVRVGTRPDAFFLGEERGRGRWLFVFDGARVDYLHTQDARGYRMRLLPAALQPVG